jgi:hypothetical protein
LFHERAPVSPQLSAERRDEAVNDIDHDNGVSVPPEETHTAPEESAAEAGGAINDIVDGNGVSVPIEETYTASAESAAELSHDEVTMAFEDTLGSYLHPSDDDGDEDDGLGYQARLTLLETIFNTPQDHVTLATDTTSEHEPSGEDHPGIRFVGGS